MIGFLAIVAAVKPAMSGEPKLSESEVVQIANSAAKAAGFKLSDFQKPNVRERVEKNGTWSVFYNGKEVRLGNHFDVIVEEATKRATVRPGQ
jgi:hypothetical protein